LKARATFTKRKRENEKAERKKRKAEKREQKKLDDADRPEDESDEDPDLAGIVAGPQKLDPDLFGAESLTDAPPESEKED
jgi:hypothetical protein